MAIIRRGADECQEDWRRLLDDIADTEHVILRREEDGTARVSWSLPANI
jgi:hypothetical protein